MRRNLIVLTVLVMAIIGVFGGAMWLYCYMYPLDYEAEIKEYAATYNVDPALVASMINVESRFQPKKVSNKGAVGLMQIMPSTAEEIAKKLDRTYYDLFHPATNIEFGCYYLKYLTTQVGSELSVLLASYNAGFNKVNEWLTNKDYSDNGVTLIKTPYKETNQYIEKVNQNYRVYQARF